MKTKTSKKQKIILSLISATAIASSAILTASVASAMILKNHNHSLNNKVTLHTTTLSNLNSVNTIHNALADISPLSLINTNNKTNLLATTTSTIPTPNANILNLLNLNHFSSLALSNNQTLTLKNYVLTSIPTIYSTSISFSAICVSNPLTNADVTITFNHDSTIIPANSTVWVYCNTNGQLLNSPTLPSSYLSDLRLFTLNGFSMVYGKNNTAPVANTSVYENASNYLTNHFQAIVTSDLTNLLTYLNTAGKLTVEAMGYNASLTITNLSIDWKNTSFNAANNTVTISDLTGDINIQIAKLDMNLNLKINNPSLTLNASALLMNEVDGNVQTIPAITTNTLSSVILGQIPNNFAKTTYHFGYLLNSNTSLSLFYTNNKPFSLASVSFGYLFYNFWMAKHPTSLNHSYKTSITYGSVYNDNNINLTSASLPTVWDNALNNNVSTSITNISLPTNNSLMSNLLELATNHATNNTRITILNNEYPTIFSELVSQVSWLSALNSAISIYGFTLNVTKLTDGNLQIVLANVLLANNNAPNSSMANNNETTYYLKLNGANYILYPTWNYANNLNLYTTITLNIPVSLSAKNIKDLSNIFNLSNLSLNFNEFTNYSKDYYTANMFADYLNDNVNSFATLLNDTLNWKNLTISDLKYSVKDNNLVINSFNITNTSNNLIILNINNTQTNLWPNETININTTNITLTNFLNVYNINNNVDINTFNNSSYANLLTTNFAATSSNNYKNNSSLLSVLSNILFNNEVSVTSYSSNASSNTSKTLTITSLTLTSATNLYLMINSKQTLILANTPYTFKNLKLIIGGFNLSIGVTVNDYLQAYLNECTTWLSSLSLSEITNDFEQMNNLKNLTTSMPSPTDLNYSNFSVSLANWNSKALTLNITSMKWNISGDALDIPVLGKYPITVNLDFSGSQAIKLIPVLYFTLADGQKSSYPQIIDTATNKQVIDGISKEVSVSTTLDYNNLPASVGDINNISFGYFISDVNESVNSISGQGVNLPLSGADAQYKPDLNISNAFNQSAMFNHYNANGDLTSAYGSINSKVTTITFNNNFSVYDISKYAINSDINNFTNWNITTFFNDLYSYTPDKTNSAISLAANATIAKDLLDLPYGVSLTNFQIEKDNTINELTFANTSHLTYVLNEGDTDFYLLPQSSNQVFKLPTSLSFNFNTLNKTNSIDLDTLYWKNNSYVVNLFHTTRILADQFCMLYSLIYDNGDQGCLSVNWWHTYWTWTEGDKILTVNKTSWTDDKVLGENSTMYEYMIYDVLFDTNTFNNEIGAYSAYYNSKANTIVVTSLTINGSTLATNLSLTLGNRFRLAGSII